MRLAPEDLLARLAALGIEARTVHHAPVFTVEQARAQREGLDGSFIKNLFLRDKKGRMWLVVVPEDRRVDLAWLAAELDVKHLSFASAERLRRTLGVEPGSVTPFGVINDSAGEVTVVIDRAVFERDPIYAHPLVNDATTAIRGDDLLRFLDATDHAPRLVRLP